MKPSFTAQQWVWILGIAALFMLVGFVIGLSAASINQRVGIVYGAVSIGPFCPVEPATGCPIPSGTYSTRSLLFTRGYQMVSVSLKNDGHFFVLLPAGTYSVTMTDCNFVGCSNTLPRQIVVTAYDATVLDISIDTGIR